jgi:acyl-coenzyme A thioesterase PaaI-like protein
MNLAKRVSDLIPSVDGSLNFVRELWDRLSQVPGGKAVFSKAIGRAAPYTGNIDARVRQLQLGFAQVTMNDRRPLRNHLKCLHAVALVNLVELTGNLALAYSLPDDGRFIVSGLSVEYLKKARGTITAESIAPIVETAEKKAYLVEVVLRDADDDIVVRGTLNTLVGPKPKKKG